jgi:hypothetical protein
MGTVPIHESVAKVATRDLLGVENGFAVSKTGHIALLRHNQIQWLVRPIPAARPARDFENGTPWLMSTRPRRVE